MHNRKTFDYFIAVLNVRKIQGSILSVISVGQAMSTALLLLAAGSYWNCEVPVRNIQGQNLVVGHMVIYSDSQLVVKGVGAISNFFLLKQPLNNWQFIIIGDV